MKLPTIKECESAMICKGDLIKRLYPKHDQGIDTAIPWNLQLTLEQEGVENPAFQIATGYCQETGVCGAVLPLTREMARVLLERAVSPELLKEQWKAFGLDWETQEEDPEEALPHLVWWVSEHNVLYYRCGNRMGGEFVGREVGNPDAGINGTEMYKALRRIREATGAVTTENIG